MSTRHAIYQFGDWCLDPAERLLLRNGVRVPLTPKAFETLLVLVEKAGHLVTKSEFMRRVWPDAFVEDVALAQNISQLRKVLATSSTECSIVTVPKLGYRLLGLVQLMELDEQQSTVSQTALPPLPSRPVTLTDEKVENREERKIPEGFRVAEVSRRSDLATWTHGTARFAVFFAVVLVVLAVVSSFILRGSRVSSGSTGASIAASPAFVHRGSKIVPLISLPGEEGMPAFSPDGSRVAFVWQNPRPAKSGVYAVVVGSQSVLRLSSDGRDKCPTWSPDGRYVAFLRNSDDKFSIRLVPALGGPERLVYSGNRSPWDGAEGLSFSPDGKALAFAEWDLRERQSSIKVLSLEDSSVRTLTSPPNGYHDAAPAFAPEGTSLAFIRSTGPIFLDELFVLQLAGGSPTQLTFDHHRIFGAPVWTQDGSTILFASNRAGLKSLWLVPASGGSPRPLLGPGPVADHPSISSATHDLAYEYSVEDENLWSLELRNGTRRGPPTALFSSKTSNLMPQFSPDGRKIAFEGDRSGYEEIWICDPDGSNPQQVTSLERFSGSPRWSPDGHYLAFDSRREKHSGIYIVNIANGSVQEVTTFTDADSVVPSWSQDGQWIYFASDHASSVFHVWKVAVNGGLPVMVTRHSGFAAFESGHNVFYTRLSEPGIWRIPRDGGPERLYWPGPGPDNWSNWALGRDGIYFIAPTPVGKSEITRLDFQTKRASPITVLERPSFYGLTISPDVRSILYSQRDRDEHDVVITKLAD